MHKLPVTLYTRQPIFDADLNIFAYEIFFLNENETHKSVHNKDEISAQLILNAFTELPFENLLNGKKGFVNFTQKLLHSPPPISENQIVIEVFEKIDIADGVIQDIKSLKKSGYTIALNNYLYNENHHELLIHSDIVKINVLSKSDPMIRSELQALRRYKPLLLAEKIETKEIFLQCKELGFSLFQGHFLSKPDIVKGRKINADQKAIMRLLNVLQDQDAGFQEVEAVISTSSVLSYKLLRLINSSSFTFQSKIDSIQMALTLLGLEKIRSWGSLLTLTEMSSKPRIVCINALARSQMCKMLAELFAITEMRGDSLFTAGLLSTMDIFLDMPMENIVNSLSLSKWLKDTILNRTGNMGLILNTAVAYEMSALDTIDWDKLNKFNIKPGDVQSCYLESLKWATETAEQFS